MGWLEALVLGIVQGLTEFLPISSSAHLSIVGQFYGGKDPGSAFTAISQLGTETAVIIYFRKDIWLIIKNWSLALVGKIPRNDPEARMGWLVIIGSLPIVILGLLFQDAIDSSLRNLWITTGHAGRVRRRDRRRRPLREDPFFVFMIISLFNGSRFIDPVSLAIVMSMQSGLIIPSQQRLLRVFR